MQLVGIGFSSHDWNTVIKQLQIHISHQLNTKLYAVVNSVSETKNWLKDTENLSADILNQNPDWLLFTPREFESAENCLNLLDKVQKKSRKRAQKGGPRLYAYLHLWVNFWFIFR